MITQLLLQSSSRLLYYSTRKLFIPGCRLTHQLTINRSHFTVHHAHYLSHHSSSSTPSKQLSPLKLFKLLKLLKILKRTLFLSLLFGPLLVLGLPLHLCGLLKQHHLYTWLKWSLSRAGGTFIKLAQWSSTRPDLLPQSLCSALESLQSRAPVHAVEWTEGVVRDGSGIEVEELEGEPIGSGTIAQVHRARLKGDNKWVALKVCHPGIEELITIDLQILLSLASAADSLFPSLRWLSLPSELHLFSQLMHHQVDLRAEALHLARFRENFEATGKAWGRGGAVVRFPRVMGAGRGWLIEELVSDSSVPIGALYDIEDSKIKDQVALIGFRALMQMLLWDNFVHADLHPGNLHVSFLKPESRKGRLRNALSAILTLAQRILNPGPLPQNDSGLIMKLEGESDTQFLRRVSGMPGIQPQLVILDCGLVTELSARDFQNFTDLFRCLVLEGDGWGAGKLMIERSPEGVRGQVRDAEGFCGEMGELVRPYFGGGSADRRGDMVKSSQSSQERSQDQPQEPQNHPQYIPHHPSHQPHQPHNLLPPLLLIHSSAPTTLRTLHIHLTLAHLFSLCRKHHVRVDPAFVGLVMSLGCVEGLGRRMAPEMDLRGVLVEGALQYLVRVVM